MKFIVIVNDSFFVSYVTNMRSQVVIVVSYIDPTVTLFSHTHLLLVFLAAFILIFILLPPILLLLVFPTTCFRKVSTCLKPRWVLTLKIFTDTFHGSYKDGTNGTRDYRPISGIIFLFWILLPVVNAIVMFTTNTSFSWLVSFSPLAIALSIACVVFEPYKHRAANISGTVLLFILTIAAGVGAILDIYRFSTGTALLCIAVLTLPHCMFYGYGIYWLVKWFKHCATTENGEEGFPCSLVRNRNYQLLNT